MNSSYQAWVKTRLLLAEGVPLEVFEKNALKNQYGYDSVDKIIMEVILELDERYQTIVALAYGGSSAESIHSALESTGINIKLNTVKTYLTRSKKNILYFFKDNKLKVKLQEAINNGGKND